MKTPAFKPHFNRELGGYYHSSKDYVADMKKIGAEPYRPDKVKKASSIPYQRSKWCNDMIADIKNRKGGKPGDKFLNELAQRGYSQKSYNKARRLANGEL